MTDKTVKTVRAGMEVHTTQKPHGARLSREIQARIGNNLRAMYDEVVGQGVPDRFSDLLKRLDQPAAKDSGE